MTTVMIGIRIGKAEKKRLKEAAKLARMTLSGFIRDAARIEAHSILGLPPIVPQQDASVTK